MSMSHLSLTLLYSKPLNNPGQCSGSQLFDISKRSLKMKINSSLKSAKGKVTETPLPIFFVNLAMDQKTLRGKDH